MRFATVVFGLGLILSGCATKYQDMGFSGGVSAQQMTANSFRIASRGNGFTGRSQVQDYTMLKAAETAKQHGATHFAIISSDDASRVDQFVTSGTSRTTFAGNTAYTTYNPGQVHNFYKPGQDTYIRIMTIPQGHAPPHGAISADEVIQYVGSRVARG